MGTSSTAGSTHQSNPLTHWSYAVGSQMGLKCVSAGASIGRVLNSPLPIRPGRGAGGLSLSCRQWKSHGGVGQPSALPHLPPTHCRPAALVPDFASTAAPPLSLLFSALDYEQPGPGGGDAGRLPQHHAAEAAGRLHHAGRLRRLSAGAGGGGRGRGDAACGCSLAACLLSRHASWTARSF